MKSPFLSTNFILGVSLELGSVILCVLITSRLYYGGGFPFVQLFFGAIYIIGARYIFKSDVSHLLKLTLVFWWVGWLVAWGAYTLLVYGWESTQMKYETFLLPQGYRGKVIVHYNEPNGNEPVFEDDRLLFEVPKDGAVHTVFKRRLNRVYPNNTNPQFFYVNDKGQRSPIKMANDPSLQEEEVFVQEGGYGYETNATYISWGDFVVFTKKELDNYYNGN
jgi:hypothetical protein